ncbi:MAG: carboxylating nicotinate-nucleotide diphosphorylase [Rhodospirillales bacterium]|nr:carboxylating nicotinate-nucleotide diphosphorylase [Rhodospirillales bacterium]MCB9996710.1 carboxylating nicotinate-nucleotide diphosphorylase [Rhodospirillales bacterium]
MTLPHIVITELVRRTLLEDLGHGHDSTSEALIPADHKGKLVIKARESGCLAGMDLACAAFAAMDPALNIKPAAQDGNQLNAGQALLTVEGNARAILAAERTALNFLMHLSGIATQTAAYVAAVKGTKAAITCTRKTLPGLRTVQKYAVRVGGGKNHRFGLDDGILIKDNHIALAGGIENAIAQARSNAGHMVKIEVEVDTLEQLENVLEAQVDAILLDNMAPDILKQAVAMIGGRALSEASGGITLETVRAVAESGVDLISVGALTHSVKALDIGLDIDL